MTTMATEPSSGGPGSPAAGDDDRYPDDIDAKERYVLYCLSRHGRMALGDLADEVTVWETGRRLPDVPPSECREAYLSLYHTHVPRLVRSGLVDYDEERDLVALSDPALGLACREPPRPDAEGVAPSTETRD